MFDTEIETRQQLCKRLAEQGYWVARAAIALQREEFAEVIAICQEQDEASLTDSSLLLRAQAWFRSGQKERAKEQLYSLLTHQPDCPAAIKELADLKFDENDQYGAMGEYRRILELDPNNRGVASRLEKSQPAEKRTITLKAVGEGSPQSKITDEVEIPFVTETIGDLYFRQGHRNRAVAVFRQLYEKHPNQRLADKLREAEGRAKEKEA
jgi:predicted Zn-dependent protease